MPAPLSKERILERVDRSGGPDSCWPWLGTRLHKRGGYGMLTVNYKRYYAHRWMYQQMVGPIPDGMLACHRCDNPVCCNPAHIFLGTIADNMADKVRKGRHLKGDQMPHSRLSESQVREIRRFHQGRYGDGRRLAREYGVSQSLISAIVRGARWQHLEDADANGA